MLDCVIALSFGYRMQDGKRLPGSSNEALAAIVHERYADLPKIMQAEVADAFSEIDPEPVMRIERHRTDVYLDTQEVLSQAAAICKKGKWQRVALVAHPGHLDRVARVAENLDLTTDDVQLETIRSLDVPFDPHSEQSWTRSSFGLKTHELAANALYKARGHI